MSRSKIIIMVVILIILVSSLGYLTYLVQNGDDPLTLFNLRAANEDEELEDLLAQGDTTPTPTVAFTSNNPQASESAGSISVSPTLTSTPTPTPTIEAVMTVTPTPTLIKQLPVSGITDNLNTTVIGGFALILLALFL